MLSPALPLAANACGSAAKARIGMDDCLYVALAEPEKCEQVTADDKRIKRLQAPSVAWAARCISVTLSACRTAENGIISV
jgi:hypothetical protein